MPDMNVKNKTYSTQEVAELSGFSVRQIAYWDRQGIIAPSVQQAKGSGTKRRYSVDDLLQLRFVKQLRGHGWSVQKIREAVFKLREVMDDPNILQRAVPVHGAKTILAICKNKEGERVLIDCLDTGGQQVMWVFLWMLQEEALLATEAQIEKVASKELI